MTRFIHDQFAKDYLETLLEPFGTVRTPRRVTAEAQQIDVWFEPTRTSLAGLSELGCLGRMAATSSIFEPCLECVLHSGGAACGIAFRTLKAPWENPELRTRFRKEPTSKMKLVET